MHITLDSLYDKYLEITSNDEHINAIPAALLGRLLDGGVYRVELGMALKKESKSIEDHHQQPTEIQYRNTHAALNSNANTLRFECCHFRG